VAHGHHALGHHQIAGRSFEPSRRQLQQDATCLGCRRAEFRAADARSPARSGEAIGGDEGIGPDVLHLGQVEVQFFGRNLPQRGRPALPQLDVACEDRRRVIGMNRDVGVDLRGIRRAGDLTALDGEGVTRLLFGANLLGNAQADNHGPCRLQKLTAGQRRP
jgi:hypothetical protein